MSDSLATRLRAALGDQAYDDLLADSEALAAKEPASADPIEALPLAAALRLVLPPTWFAAMCEVLSAPQRAALAAAAAAGLCRHDPPGRVFDLMVSPGGGFVDVQECWMIDVAARRRTLDRAQEELPPGAIERELEMLAAGLLKQADLPRLMQPWCMLARYAAQAAPYLIHLCNQALAQDEREFALELVTAARDLSLALPELSAAADAAGRRIDLAARRADDLRRLAAYQPCQAAQQAINRLLDGPDEVWGLHVVGVGGAGKTMLMRDLTARLAPQRGFATARIDFDHLSPDYPVQSPALLLGMLAAELVLHGGEAAAGSSGRLHTEMELQASRYTLAAGDASVTHQDAAFDSAVSLFVALIRELDQPVLIILDTCEELVRLDAATRQSQAVHRALGLFETVQERLRSAGIILRVVFSGRRPLARAGDGWRLDPSVDVPANLAPRPWLALHELRGFDRPEALNFLAARQIVGPAADRVLHVARVPAGARRLARTDSAGEPADAYLPFDLDLFAGMLAGDSGAGWPELSRSTAAAYVGARILDRLGDRTLREVMPVIVQAGEVDRALLAAMAGLRPDSAALEGLWNRLRHQEWAERRPDEAIGIDPLLRARLIRAGLAPAASDPALRRALAHLDTVLHAAPDHPAPYLRLWQLLAVRSAAQGAAVWAALEAAIADRPPLRQAIGVRLLDPTDSADELPRHPLAAQGLAMLATAETVLSPAGALARWAAAEVALGLDPDQPQADQLRLRCLGGRVVAALQRGTDPADAPLAELAAVAPTPDAAADAEVAAALLAAMEAVLEAREAGRLDADTGPDARAYVGFAKRMDGQPADLAAFAASLAGRALARSGAWQAARAWFQESLAQAQAAGRAARMWLHWVPPPVLPDRLRLEALRHAWPDHQDPRSALLDWHAAPAQAGQPDDGRIAALAIRMAAATGPVIAAHVGGGPNWEPQAPSCQAHVAVPPPAVAQAELLASAGMIEVARQHLQQAKAAAMKADRLATVVELDRAELRLFRRHRLFEYRPLPGRPPEETAADRITLAEIAALATGAPPDRLGAAAGAERALLAHAAFACTRWGVRPESLAVADLLAALDDATRPDWQAALCVDAWEIVLPERAPGENLPSNRLEVASLLQCFVPGGTALRLRTAARAAALCNDPDRFEPLIDRLAVQLGHRQAALLLVEEAELATLRRPSLGAAVARRAIALLPGGRGDPLGYLQAVVVHWLARAATGLSTADAAALIEEVQRAARQVGLKAEHLHWPGMDGLGQVPSVPPLRPWLRRAVPLCAFALARLGDSTPLQTWQAIARTYQLPTPPDLTWLNAAAPPGNAAAAGSDTAAGRAEVAATPTSIPDGAATPAEPPLRWTLWETRPLSRWMLLRNRVLALAAEAASRLVAWVRLAAGMISMRFVSYVIARRAPVLRSAPLGLERLDELDGPLPQIWLTALGPEPPDWPICSTLCRLSLESGGDTVEAEIRLPPPTVPTSQAAAALPKLIADRLHRLDARPMLLILDLTLAAQPFEALFADRHPHAGQCVRILPDRQRDPWRGSDDAPGGFVLASPAWRTLRGRLLDDIVITSLDAILRRSGKERPQVMLLQAEPIRYGREVRLHSGTESALAPEALVRLARGVCVLQLPDRSATDAGRTAQTETERFDNALLRLFAAQAHHAGMPLVACLPRSRSLRIEMLVQSLSRLAALPLQDLQRVMPMRLTQLKDMMPDDQNGAREICLYSDMP